MQAGVGAIHEDPSLSKPPARTRICSQSSSTSSAVDPQTFRRHRLVPGRLLHPRSDIDLVCYGTAGYEAAHELFSDIKLIRPYAART